LDDIRAAKRNLEESQSRRAAPVISDPISYRSSSCSKLDCRNPVVLLRFSDFPKTCPSALRSKLSKSQSRRAAPVISDRNSDLRQRRMSPSRQSQSRRAAPVISDRCSREHRAPHGIQEVAIPSCCSGHFRLSPLQLAQAEPLATPSAVTPSGGCGKRLSPRRSALFIVPPTSFPIFSYRLGRYPSSVSAFWAWHDFFLGTEFSWLLAVVIWLSRNPAARLYLVTPCSDKTRVPRKWVRGQAR
jgi:hypothetical protein